MEADSTQPTDIIRYDSRSVPPEPRAIDAIRAWTIATVGTVPLAGFALQTAFEQCWQSPIERRRDEWTQQLAERVAHLERHGVPLATLLEDRAFVDTVVQATHVAAKHTHAEKRAALLNAITNSAMPAPPEESKRAMFLRYIDEFTVWHLRILGVLARAAQAGTYTHTREPPLRAAFPDLPDYYKHLVRDLATAGLVPEREMDGTQILTRQGRRTTRMAEPIALDFLEFISPPAWSAAGGRH